MWRLIDSGPGPGSWNMAVDEAVLEGCVRGEVPPTLRFYSWRPPAISLGHFQQAEKALHLEACRQKGLEVCRRPTGGRAILHDKEITFSIVAPLAFLGTQGVMDSYRCLSQGIIAGLRRLGVKAELVERSDRRISGGYKSAPTESAACAVGAAFLRLRSGQVLPPERTPTAACFAVKARCDLMVSGRKIVGSAQVHRQQVLLQQNSLPFVVEPEKWKEVFQGMEGVGEEAVGLWETAGCLLQLEEVAQALKEGFKEALGIEFFSGGLTGAEQAQARALQSRCLVQPAEIPAG